MAVEGQDAADGERRFRRPDTGEVKAFRAVADRFEPSADDAVAAQEVAFPHYRAADGDELYRRATGQFADQNRNPWEPAGDDPP